MEDIKHIFEFPDHKVEVLIKQTDNNVYILQKIIRYLNNIPHYYYGIDEFYLDGEEADNDFSLEEVMSSFIKSQPINGCLTYWNHS